MVSLGLNELTLIENKKVIPVYMETLNLYLFRMVSELSMSVTSTHIYHFIASNPSLHANKSIGTHTHTQTHTHNYTQCQNVHFHHLLTHWGLGISYQKSMGLCKKDITPLLTHWSYVFLALTHRSDLVWVMIKHLLNLWICWFIINDTSWGI